MPLVVGALGIADVMVIAALEGRVTDVVRSLFAASLGPRGATSQRHLRGLSSAGR
jgi:hypothetical protein